MSEYLEPILPLEIIEMIFDKIKSVETSVSKYFANKLMGIKIQIIDDKYISLNSTFYRYNLYSNSNILTKEDLLDYNYVKLDLAKLQEIYTNISWY